MTKYRDSKTGRFVSKKTWERSKSHGGTRYKRQVLKEKPAPVALPARTPKTVDEWEDAIDEAEDFVDQYGYDAEDYFDAEEIEGGTDY